MNDEFDNAVGPKQDIGKARRKAIGVFLIIGPVLGLSVTTQVIAADFRYQSLLGDNFHHVYPPWAVLWWIQRWGGSPGFESAFNRGSMFGLAATAMAFVVIVKLLVGKLSVYLHGSARWANRRDLVRAGLLRGTRRWFKNEEAVGDEVIVGSWKNPAGEVQYLTHSGPEHLLAMAPTRSGKGVGLVLPTLLSWRRSAFVLDIKGELAALTAGWRHSHAGNTVLRFEPAKSESVRWNPLDEIRMGTDHEVGDVQNLALLLVDPNGKGVEGDHWRSTAMSLLVGVILHVLHTPAEQRPSLASIDRFFADPAKAAEELWQEMLESDVSAVRAEGRKMLNRPEEEAGSVLSTAQRCLALYHDPVVAANTATSDFKIRDLMHSEEPVTLYLVTQPADKDRIMPLVRIFVSLTIRLLADDLEFENGRPKAGYKHPLLMMMDEFVALKKLNILQEALAYIAGYGIKIYLICQDRQQLTSRDYGYGPDETITGNCHIQMIMRPDKVETAEYVSKKVGQTTVEHKQVTHNGGIFGKASHSIQYSQRPLRTPDECMRMQGALVEGKKIKEGGEMMVFAAGMPAVRGPQPLYFKDPVFAARAAVPAPCKPLARAGESR